MNFFRMLKHSLYLWPQLKAECKVAKSGTLAVRFRLWFLKNNIYDSTFLSLLHFSSVGGEDQWKSSREIVKFTPT
jgi:hypothetical protein